MSRQISTLRDCIEFAEQNGILLRVNKEVDPCYEIASVTKSFDGGPQIIFEAVKGYPGWKVLSNLMGNRDLIAKYFGTTKDSLSERLIKCMADPIEPVFSENPSCQENIIDKEIDILKTLPVIKHTTLDIGPVITGGVAMVRYPTEIAKEDLAFNLSYHRLNPSRGPD